MHFNALAIINVPEVKPQPDMDRNVEEMIDHFKKSIREAPISFGAKMNLRHWNGLRTAFARMVYVLTQDAMAPYDCNTGDPKLLTFEDHTEQLQKEYTEGTDDCIRFPDGRIFQANSYLAKNFVIRNGKVMQRRAGPLKHPKVTRKCRKMKALPAYPRIKLYKSMADYAENGCGMVFNKQHNAYGYTFNPNGMWDFFSIGGRWPFAFLVKEDCEYSPGNYDVMDYEERAAPDGFRWVSAARKKDIAWDEMRKWFTEANTKNFYELEAMFKSGQVDKERLLILQSDGICTWNGYLYHEGDTLETFLAKHDIPAAWKYPVNFTDLIICNKWHNGFVGSELSNAEEQEKREWRETFDRAVDEAPDESVFVSIDYHM